MKKSLALMLALLLLLSMPFPVHGAEQNADNYIEQLICCYQYYQEDARLDLDLLLEQLGAVDAPTAWKWQKIMDHWSWVNTEMDIDPEILPDGLPGDDSLCIVVLGYALKRNGDMQSELIGRLETALASAEKYPNAYIAVTGGSTARNDPDATEAGEMAKWLVEHGINEGRIIIEDESLSTVNNAQYTCALLNEAYPQIEHLAIVTSDYHQGRGALLFEAEAILSGYAMSVVSIASYRTDDHELDSVKQQASALAHLAGYSTEDFERPRLTKLKEIVVSGDTQCPVGSELNLQVHAVYSNGYRKNITSLVNYSGFDFNEAGLQTITVQYSEYGETYKAAYDVEFLPGELPLLSEETEPLATEAAVIIPEPVPAEKPEPSFPVLISTAVTLLCLLFVLLILKNRRK